MASGGEFPGGKEGASPKIEDSWRTGTSGTARTPVPAT